MVCDVITENIPSIALHVVCENADDIKRMEAFLDDKRPLRVTGMHRNFEDGTFSISIERWSGVFALSPAIKIIDEVSDFTGIVKGERE